ncbi:hypothetical protein FQN49_004778 [Arthroderma sp. PD_2]|nr:hypothetical protein FQN49_004778 [Arthroderma sp. PD_2]
MNKPEKKDNIFLLQHLLVSRLAEHSERLSAGYSDGLVIDTLPAVTSTGATMSKPHLANEEFFAFLESLLTKQSGSSRGSVFLTQKRFPSPPTNKAESQTVSDTPSSSPPLILIRASNGKHKDSKAKASTVVKPEELEAFYRRYAEICKAGMVGLKKRDRSAKKKGKAKGKK